MPSDNENIGLKEISGLRDYISKHFEIQANQRLTLFRFYSAFIVLYLYGIGYLMTHLEPKSFHDEVSGIAVSILFIFITYIFQCLDQRNREIIKISRDAICYIESKYKYKDIPDNELEIVKIFTFDQTKKNGLCRIKFSDLVNLADFTGVDPMLSFKWKHFKRDIILMLVRWYLAYSLSYRDVEELALERGLKVDHSTIQRWVVEYSPQMEDSFRKRHKRPTGGSLRMDETYIKVKGQWTYLYRVVDKEGNTVDFMLSEKRDEPAARAFFLKAIGSNGIPHIVTMDKSGANKASIDTINLYLTLLFILGGLFLQIKVRQVKYLNNIVEQDHRFIKKLTKPMKGFKAFHSAKATLAGIELHHMLRKGQHLKAGNQSVFEQFYGLAA